MSVEIGIIEKLLAILTQMHTLVQDVLEEEDNKYDAIRELEIEQLLVINERESVLLAEIESLELKRKDAIESLSLRFGFDPNAPIRQITPFFPEEFATAIFDISLKIKNDCVKIDVSTDRNAYLLNANLELIGQVLEIAQGGISNYNSQGMIQESHNQKIHMLDQLV